MDSLIDKIYQNAIDIQSMALQIIAWINQIKSNQDNIVAVKFDKFSKSAESNLTEVQLNALLELQQISQKVQLNAHQDTENNITNVSDGTSEIADCQLNRTQNLNEIDNFKEIMKRKFGKGSYCLRKVTRKDGSIYKYYQGVIYLNGKPKTVTASTVKEIEKKLNKLFHSKEIRPKKDDSIGFTEWAQIFAKKKISTLSPRYSKTYQQNIDSLCGIFDKYKLNQITAEQIENFLATKTPSTQRKLYDILNNIFSDAVRLRKITENPCGFVLRPKVKQKKFRCYEFFEQNIMINELPKDYSDLFIFLCCTGLRISECLALTQKDITPKYIRIWKIKDSVNNEIVETTKNGEERKVLYHESLLKYLNLDFITSVNYRTVNRMYAKYYKQFDNINLHSTRHTYASLAHYVGIDEKVIQSQLGHKTLAMTQDTYTNLLLDGNSVIKDYFFKLEKLIMSPRRT